MLSNTLTDFVFDKYNDAVFTMLGQCCFGSGFWFQGTGFQILEEWKKFALLILNRDLMIISELIHEYALFHHVWLSIRLNNLIARHKTKTKKCLILVYNVTL